MRILVLGAGGTGGYFGGRLAQAGVDVTFLVRPARAAQLERHGLQIRSPRGDADVPVAHVTADTLPALAAQKPFDLVILSCKAYDLDSSLDAIAPAVGEHTTVLPILNGLLHYAALDARFGRDRVLGGLCFISATKGEGGEVLHLAPPASITFGERDSEAISPRVAAFAAACTQAGIDHKASAEIARDQWIKYTYLATLGAGTCLMRGSVGQIVSSEGGAAFMAALYAETLAVADAVGVAIPDKAQGIARAAFAKADSADKASMLRDLEAGYRVEAAHIIGDMCHRAAQAGIAAPLLQAAWVNLQVYQAARGE